MIQKEEYKLQRVKIDDKGATPEVVATTSVSIWLEELLLILIKLLYLFLVLVHSGLIFDNLLSVFRLLFVGLSTNEAIDSSLDIPTMPSNVGIPTTS